MKRKSLIGLLLLVAMMLAACEEETPFMPYRPVGTGQSPDIHSISISPSTIWVTGSVDLSCRATDPDGDSLSYRWTCDGGAFTTGVVDASATWKAPISQGRYLIAVKVSDGNNNSDSTAVDILVSGNPPSLH